MMKFFKTVRMNVVTVMSLAVMFFGKTAFAAGFGESKYATGTTSLINDVFTVLTTIVIPATAGLMIAYQAWRKKVADGDGGAISDANKAIKRILIAAVIGETASGLVALVTSYYK